MKFRLLIVFLCLFVQSSTVYAQAKYSIVIARESGDYYRVGQAIAKLLNNNLDINIVTRGSQGSLENVELLLKAEAEMALVQSDILYKQSMKKDKLNERIGSIAALFPEFVQVLVKKQHIKSRYKTGG